MNTIDKHDVRAIVRYLDSIKELTDLLRRAHFNVPYRTVYDAVGAETCLRDLLLDKALTGVEIEAPEPVGMPLPPFADAWLPTKPAVAEVE